jgi:hypothetical protein
MSPPHAARIGSLFLGFLTFRFGVIPFEEATEALAGHENHPRKRCTDYLKGEEPGTRINVSICRLRKSAEHSHQLDNRQYTKHHS